MVEEVLPSHVVPPNIVIVQHELLELSEFENPAELREVDREVRVLALFRWFEVSYCTELKYEDHRWKTDMSQFDLRV